MRIFLSPSRLSRPVLMASVALCAVTLAHPALAVDALDLPTGENVVGGSATFDRSQPTRLDIHQSTERTVIDWNTFNIGTDATTEFFQPSNAALAVNRVTGGSDPTQILGTLRANGRVMVLDRNGVIFGHSARVDVGGIIASTGDVDTQAVMSGTDRIDLNNMASGRVENHGTITAAQGGLVALVAPSVRNSGTITANLGRVALAAGNRATVDLYGDALVELALDQKMTQAIVENAGTINAESGVVQMTAAAARDAVDSVVNMTGVVNASSVHQVGGTIILGADTVSVSGTATANGTKGGTIIAKATDALNLDGLLSARGDRAGFIDTSAPTLNFSEGMAVQADRWLIDPTSLAIVNAGAGANRILASMIESGLAFGDVEVATPDDGPFAGNISLEGSVDWDSAFGLTLTAHHDLHVREGGALNANGGGAITLNAGDDIRLTGTTLMAGLYSDGGDITLNATDMVSIRPARWIDANGGNILFTNGGGMLLAPDTIRTTGTGTVAINQNKANEFEPTPGMPNTIQGAIDAIQNTGSGMNTVNVGVGLWDENVYADGTAIRYLTLNGAQAGNDARDLATRSDLAQETILSGVHFSGLDTAVLDGFWFDGVESDDSAPVVFSYVFSGTARNNVIQNYFDYGIFGYDSFGLDVNQNRINGIYGDGIRIDSFFTASVTDNDIANVTDDGIHVSNGSYADITGNNISDVTGFGYETGSFSAFYKGPSGYDDWNGSDGIFVQNVGTYGHGEARLSLFESSEGPSFALNILNNTVARVTDDGIDVLNNGGSMLIDGNTINDVNDDGIILARDFYNDCWDCGDAVLSFSSYISPYKPYMNAVITNNAVTEAGYRGIAVDDLNETEIGNNTLTNAVAMGVHVTGTTYGYHNIHGNTVANSHVGMLFQSGLIDLTGDTNTLNGGSTGYQFDPLTDNGYPYPTLSFYDDYEGYDYDYGYVGLDLVDNTIGTTIFNEQSTYYVELLGDALFNPGAPTLEDGLNATYDGLNPAANGGLITFDQLAQLEAMFWHYNDDNNVGLFFFGTGFAPGSFGIEDVFNEPPSGGPPPGGAQFIITGLPLLPGQTGPGGGGTTPTDLNAIAPAAGGEEGEDERLAALEPAAGGEDAACWGDAIRRAGATGQNVNYAFSGDPASALNDTAQCGQGQ